MFIALVSIYIINCYGYDATIALKWSSDALFGLLLVRLEIKQMYGHPSVIKLIARVKEHLKHGQHGLDSFSLGPKSVNVFGHGALQIHPSYINKAVHSSPASLNYIESAIKQKIRYISRYRHGMMQ